MKRPFVYLAIVFSLGIYISSIVNLPLGHLFIATLAAVVLSLVLLKKDALSHAIIYLAVFLVGALIFKNSTVLSTNHISNFTPDDSTTVFLKGSIVDDPIVESLFYRDERATFLLNAQYIKDLSAWKKTSGLVRVDIQHPREEFEYGDELILEGALSRPNSLSNPGGFSYSKYLEMKNIYSILRVKDSSFIKKTGRSNYNLIKTIAYTLRRKIKGSVEQHFDEPYDGFLKAILIGDRQGLKRSLNEEFIKTGTVHILSISGLHVVMIAGLFFFLFSIVRMPLKLNLALSAILIVFYSVMAGSSPPIIRAAVMFSISVVGYLISRDADILNSLAISLFAVLLLNPKELFDPSLQLSFASIAGIVIFAPRLTKKRSYILKGISVSIAAWLGTSPLISLYFNTISPISIIANLIAIPLSFLVMVISFLFIFVNSFSCYLAHYVAITSCVIQKALFFVNHILSDLPFAYFRIPSPPVSGMWLYYALLFSLIMPTVIRFRNIIIYKRRLILIILFLINILIWKHILNSEREFLKVTFFDVGQGDAILLELPKKGAILIDSGSGGEEEKFDMERAVIAPYLWNNCIYRLDAVIATHFHEDHLGGMPYILKNFDVGCVMDNGAMVNSYNKLYNEYMRIIKSKRIRHRAIAAGDEISLSDDLMLYVLNPMKGIRLSDSNENSVVLKLVYKEKSILLCADVTGKTLERLASRGSFLKSDVLKVPHHGGHLGEDYIVRNFFMKVNPTISIISVGRRNRFKAPASDTFKIITSLNSISYETSHGGAIILLMAERSLKVVPFGKNN